MPSMLKSWAEYANAANMLYGQSNIIPIMGEFGTELEEITLDLIARASGEGKKELRFLINSSGGSSVSCIAMRNALVMSDFTTTGIVLSRAYSSGFYLLDACDNRVVIEGATILFHWGGTRLGNNELAAIMRGETWPIDHIREYNTSMLESVAKRTGIAEDRLRQFADSERYFTAREARKENLVDVVVPSRKSEIPPDVVKMLMGAASLKAG